MFIDNLMYGINLFLLEFHGIFREYIFEYLECIWTYIYDLRKVASDKIIYYIDHCNFVLAYRVLFSSRCSIFRVSLLLN